MAKIITQIAIEEDGKIIISPGEFDEITPLTFDDGEVSQKLFLAKKDDISFIISISSNSKSGYYIYRDIHNIGFINKNCIAVSSYSYNEKRLEKWAIIKTYTLNRLTDHSYDSMSIINENMYMTKKEGLFGVIDKNGNTILPNNFTEISYESAHNAFTVKPFSSGE